MSLVVKKPDRSDFIPAPAGLHRAVCVDVVDMGYVDFGKFEPKDSVKIVWQTEATGTDGKRYTVRALYTKSLGARANLRKALISWRGKDFTPAELKGFDLEKLVGANCQINVVHVVKAIDGDEVTYANVNNIVPASRDAERLASLNYTRESEREPTEARPHTQSNDPDWMKDGAPEPEEDIPDFDMEF